MEKNKKTCPEPNRKIVCIGGGTGTSVVLSGLKKYPVDLTAIVTMFDTGGSSGKLREELSILPLGDIRQCLLATSARSPLSDLFNYRFDRGELKGHNFGNLFIAATAEIAGGLEKAIDKIRKILDAKVKIFPVTFENANLKVVLKNNEEINGEENIINCRYLSRVGIKKIFLEPEVKANPKAILAIKNADLIIIGPGKFYTSIISNFLAEGIPEAICQSCAKKIFICNLMTQVGSTDGFEVEDFLQILEKYLGKDVIDYVIFNTGRLSLGLEREVKKVFPKATPIKYHKNLLRKKNLIGADFLDRNIRKQNPADIFVKGANIRTMVLHDPDKLAKIILNLCPTCPRQ